MGLKCSSDIAVKMQTSTLMMWVLFSHDWQHHNNIFATIVCCLCKNGFTINPLKCEWAIKETD
jgi:hypothetical protein